MKKRYFIQLVYTSLVQLLLAFIVLTLILNFFVMSYIEDEIKSNDRELVDLIQKSVDRQLASMERITKALVYNPTFTPYILLENPYKAFEAREILKTIAVANPLMEAIGTSYYFDDYLLTNETSALKSRYFKSMGFDAALLEERSLLEKGYAINSEYIIFLISMSHGIHNVPGYFSMFLIKRPLVKDFSQRIPEKIQFVMLLYQEQKVKYLSIIFLKMDLTPAIFFSPVLIHLPWEWSTPFTRLHRIIKPL
jgi:hypothetical protein